MKIEVNIDKRYFIILMSFIAILGVVLITNAYGEGTPEVIGHSWNDIGDKPAGFADGVDNVDDADSDPTNELQNLNNVLSRGNNAGGKKITNLGAPTSSSDAATRQFVLDNSGGEACNWNGWEPDVTVGRECGAGMYCYTFASTTQLYCSGGKITSIRENTYCVDCVSDGGG